MSSVTPLITVPGDDDVDLKVLQNFMLTLSWASRGILEVFYDKELWGVDGTDYNLEAGEEKLILDTRLLSVPKDDEGTTGGSKANTSYVWYSKIFTFTEDSEFITKATILTKGTTYGLANIKLETSIDYGVNWYTWYNTAELGTGDEYPNGYLDLTGIEKSSPDEFSSGQFAQIKITITTDANGWGGSVDYVAFLTDPDLFAGDIN